MPITFNTVELCVVTINEKPWTRATEVWRALEYNKKAADLIKTYCNRENYTQKYQMSSVHASCTTVSWPKDSRKDDYYFNEEGVIELLVASEQPVAKNLQNTWASK